jgi:16S rRNA (uracil1498-N3)-methyltransferase
MKEPRVFVQPPERTEEGFRFSPGNVRYLHTVLRMKQGDRVRVFDGEEEHLVDLVQCSRDGVEGRLIETLQAREVVTHEQELVLAFACVRPGPMDEIFRHGTELGVTTFVPILAERSQRRPPDKKSRWEMIVAAASAQCGRVDLPRIMEPQSLARFLAGETIVGRPLVLSPRAGMPLLAVMETTQSADLTLLIGPEGGLHPREEKEVLASGFIPVMLGSAVLRTETAALAALAGVMLWRQRQRG